jgi:hypothetical protein
MVTKSGLVTRTSGAALIRIRKTLRKNRSRTRWHSHVGDVGRERRQVCHDGMVDRVVLDNSTERRHITEYEGERLGLEDGDGGK